MKKILLASIVLNLALVLAVAYGFTKRDAIPDTEPKEEKREAASTTPKVKPAFEKTTVAEKLSNPPTKPEFNWRNVESADYKVYIANLRALHCPESTIADIIIADVSKYYRNKIAPFRKDIDTTYKYWLSDSSWNRRDPEFEKLRRETDKEKTKLLKELLGSSYKEAMDSASGWSTESSDPFFKNLSQEKRDQMAEIADKFSSMRNEIYLKMHGYQDEEDRDALKKIEQDQTAELAKILTPEELFEYQVRNSDKVRNLKWNELEGLDFSEDEFRAIAKAKLLADEANIGDQKLSSDERAQQLKEANETLKATLGEDRYKEYTLNKNWDYRNLRNIVERNGGDPKIAQQLYGLKDDLQKAISQVRNDRSLSSEQRDSKLLAIKAEVDRTLTDALTERGYKSFKRSAPWLQDLTRNIGKTR